MVDAEGAHAALSKGVRALLGGVANLSHLSIDLTAGARAITIAGSATAGLAATAAGAHGGGSEGEPRRTHAPTPHVRTHMQQRLAGRALLTGREREGPVDAAATCCLGTPIPALVLEEE